MAMTDKTPKSSQSAKAEKNSSDKPVDVTTANPPTSTVNKADESGAKPETPGSHPETPRSKPEAPSGKQADAGSRDKSTVASSTTANEKGAAVSSAGASERTARASTGGAGMPPPPSSPASPPPSPASKGSVVPVVVLGIIVVLLAGALWYHNTLSQQQFARLDQLEQLARSSQAQAGDAEQRAREALEALNAQRNAVSQLRSELKESRAEMAELGSAFQTITDRGSDLVLLNDIDHLVMIAQQQLKLNGNVANAIISLETAQAQLARANRPALASLQQSINGDLDRLRATTTVDIARLSGRLEELAGLVSEAPLVVPEGTDLFNDTGNESGANGTPVPPSENSAADLPADAPWWKRSLAQGQHWLGNSWTTLRSELNSLVSVRRVDDTAALLISPDQAKRFRDSLRQRIMTAQLALMMDQSQIWQTETQAILYAVETRFDARSALTRQAIRIARDVADTNIDTPLPDVSNSIHALEALSEQMGRHAAPAQPDASGGADGANDVSAPTERTPDDSTDEPSVPTSTPEDTADERSVPTSTPDGTAETPDPVTESTAADGAANEGAHTDSENAVPAAASGAEQE